MDAGTLAWGITSSALVLFMTPGVAFFYGGLVKAKSVISMMMMSFGAIGLIAVLWVLYGFSMSAVDSPLQFAGNPFADFGLAASAAEPGANVALLSVAYGATFAIITVALISGAIADRAKFSTWMIFAALWATIVYFPIAHWVFAFDAKDAAGNVVTHGGWIANQLKAIDFAGGTAIHINAGAAALALVLVIGNRHGFGKEPMRPHNLTLVMLGAALLWFGWFGFNAGSALSAGTMAAVAFVNTLLAPAAAILGWLAVERVRDGHATSLGAASGLVAGLVGITPAAASVSPLGALIVGVAAGVLCAFAFGLKTRLGYDDSLDVVGVHLVGGLVGTLLIGLVAGPASPAGVAGLFYGGGIDQLWRQAVGAFAVLAYSFVVTFVIAKVLDKTLGLRVADAVETQGIDTAEHAETGYDLSAVGYTTYGVRQTLIVPAREDVDA